ncbi:hypothetical protein DVH26_07805 [Paenibacillus sp. H1-7]|uniref:hypothetical protein n=1 Tax=Paenibacillus sp. H1-7 TaxID=2282849 RepID=UPI001EF98CB0|nr:hypothetical protein [Paenibacillus sp. H1-7]ULL14362.1 hypothetical protein DVH26_07805 [Paenibacillus sp. H1-7]
MSLLDELRKNNKPTPDTSSKPMSMLDQLRNEKQSIDSAHRMNQEDMVQTEIMRTQQPLTPYVEPKPELPGRDIPVVGSILKAADFIASNPISEAFAEYTVPDAPYLNDPSGKNAREAFLERSGQEPATGASKFIGAAGAPFFVPGAGLGTGNAATEASRAALQKVAPKLTGTGQTVAREALTGGLIGAGAEFAQGSGDLSDAALTGAIGAAGGAALPLAGRAIQNTKFGQAITDYFTRPNAATPEVEQPFTELLALPSPRVEARMSAALERGNLPAGSDIVVPAADIPANALPMGNYIQPQRLRVEDPTTVLNSVMQRIKPEVEETINALRQSGQPFDVPQIAFETARKYGYDLPSLLDGKAPNVSQRVSRDASARVAGVYPDSLPNIQQPEGFNISARGQAEGPVLRTGLRQTNQQRITRQQTVPEASVTAAPVNETQAIPRITEAPRSMAGKPPMQERGFAETLRTSEKTPETFSDRLKSMYRPLTNEQTLAGANKRINKDVEEATSYVLGNSRFSADKATTAQRLIDHYNSTGNIQRAVDIAEKVSEEATRAGQAIQALSMFNRLSPEGVLVYAQRLARKTNENIPVTAKEVKVTPDMAAQITNLAQVSQKMTGVKDLANDVMSILDKAKTGEKLTATEAAELRRFVDESKKFIQETTRKPKPPRPPREPKEKRIRDNVVSFLDAQEQAAKDRLRARGIQISSTPLDVWADYAMIGAAKMARGVIKFSDWSEQMVKEFGEEIRPQLQQLYERSVEAYEQSTKKVTKQSVSEAEKLTEKVIRSKQLTPADADSLRSLAKKLSDLSGEQKRLASQDLQAILQQLEKPGTLKQISSIQTMGQLLNPKTQVRNALGNELFYRVERLNKIIATPIDIARSKITGGDRTVTFRTNNQGEYWNNWMRGLKAGWKGVNVNGLETQYDLASPAFKSKYNPLTYMEKSLGAALKSFDTAAYMRAYNNTIGEMATLKAINEGQGSNKELIQKYIREADSNVMKIADEYGRYVTFQDNNAISKGLVALKKGLNFKKDFGLGDLVLKYPKTPGAILMRALEYSPAGFLRSASILARPWYKKEPDTAEVTQALSRAMIGTFGLTGLGYYLMDNGVVTGEASKDKDIRDLQKSAGQGQYQVNLSALKRLIFSGFDPSEAKLKEGDLLYTYDWMQPISIALSIGANIGKNMNEGKEKLSGLAGTVYNSLEGGLGTLTEQSVLQGLKRAAEGYPGQTITDKITDIISDIPASFVPTASNQIKQLTDNATRETYSPNKLEQSINKAKARIPGVANDLPQRYDTLGRPKETFQDNNAFNVLFNPGFSSRYELSPEAKMVIDLINETGDETLAPRVPSKSINIDGVNVKLTGDQFTRYQQLQGEETQKAIIKRYKPDATLKNRSKTMSDILFDAGTKTRDQLKKEIK